MNATARLTVLVTLAAVLTIPSTVWGFEQTKTCTESGLYACDPGEAPQRLHWKGRCVRYRLNEDGTDNFKGSSDQGSDIKELRRAVWQSFEAWNQVGCSDMKVVDGGLTSNNETTYRGGNSEENMNLVAWRNQGWESVASARAFALTSVTFNPNTGVIADADIDVNTEYYTWSATKEPEANHVDLRNTMTHEVGHFIGLDHTEIREATMYATAPVGEIAKRSLHQDDIDGLCFIYPSTDGSSVECESDEDFAENENFSPGGGGGGCSVTRPGRSVTLEPIVLMIAWIGGAWWRRRRTCSDGN